MSDVVVQRCDPRSRADQIKALFARNGQPKFDAVFERAYLPRAEHGLQSWVGIVGDQVVMHISVSPQSFGDGTRTMMGGLLGDLMADAAYRDFWSPLRLLRTMVADLKREGRLEFLLTTSIRLSESLFKAGGFRVIGRFRRFVFPLWAPYVRASRLWTRARARVITPASLDDLEFVRLLPSLRSGGLWRAHACSDFYATRIPRVGYADGVWLRVRNGGAATQPAWGLVCRHSTWPELRLPDAYWRGDTPSLADIVLAAARWGRAQGMRKLATTTLAESRLAAQLRGAGFVPRSYAAAVMLQNLGPRDPPPVTDWFLTEFVGTAW
jgi:hypothetical protein